MTYDDPELRELIEGLEDEPQALPQRPPAAPPPPAPPTRGPFRPSQEDLEWFAQNATAAPKPVVMPQPPRSRGRSLWGSKRW